MSSSNPPRINYVKVTGSFPENFDGYLRILHIAVPGFQYNRGHLQDFVCHVNNHVVINQWILNPIHATFTSPVGRSAQTRSGQGNDVSRIRGRGRQNETPESGFLQWNGFPLPIQLSANTGTLVFFLYKTVHKNFKLLGSNDIPINAFTIDVATMLSTGNFGAGATSESHYNYNYNGHTLSTTLAPEAPVVGLNGNIGYPYSVGPGVTGPSSTSGHTIISGLSLNWVS